MDDLIICPKCESDACYKQEVNENVTNYMCYGCGFISNTLMKEGEDYWKEQQIALPELYKDLTYKDKNNQYWIPNTINQPEVGMVFLNGNKDDNWTWSGVKALVVEDNEKIKYPIPGKPGKYYKHRMDMENIKHFGERGYMDALSYIGLLPE
tara:strand:- start:1187 stop:1642 length:456 start_codon:yes stop_codon:yes gene_type:complete